MTMNLASIYDKLAFDKSVVFSVNDEQHIVSKKVMRVTGPLEVSMTDKRKFSNTLGQFVMNNSDELQKQGRFIGGVRDNNSAKLFIFKYVEAD